MTKNKKNFQPIDPNIFGMLVETRVFFRPYNNSVYNMLYYNCSVASQTENTDVQILHKTSYFVYIDILIELWPTTGEIKYLISGY